MALNADIDTPPLQQALQRAANQNLEYEHTWLRLLHYEKSLFGGWKSKVISNEFFLAASGNTSPKDELERTIKVLLDPAKQDERCRFPARMIWLSNKLNIVGNIDRLLSSCSDYHTWSSHGAVQSISLFFANGYLENPASFFGHAFIRFNVGEHLENTLFSKSIDYGAVIPPDENAIIYIAKGVFGGYVAGFSDGNFYRNNFNYGEVQLRDLWEYKLNLTQQEIQFLVAHLWELMPHKFKYFFTYENCGTAMAELLELVRPEIKFYGRHKPWVIPTEIFRRLQSAQGGHMLYSQVTFHPSRQARLNKKVESLQKNEKKALANSLAGSDLLSELNIDEQKNVIDTALDYYQLLITKSGENELAKKKKNEFLIKRVLLPPGESKVAARSDYSELPPHTNNPPSKLRLLYGKLSDNSGGIIEYRPVQSDLLNPDNGRPPNSEVRFFDLAFKYSDETLSFKNLDLLKITSLNPGNKFFNEKNLSWSLGVNYGEHHFGCESCEVARVSGGVGRSLNLSSLRATTYVLVSLEYASAFSNYEPFSLVPTFGWIGSFGDKSKYRIEYSSQINGFKAIDKVNVQYRYQLNRDIDFRMSYAKNIGEEVMAGVSYYW